MAPKANHSVLIVAENRQLRQSCSRLLAEAGWEVVHAENTAEATTQARTQIQHPFSLIIWGNDLSGADGDAYFRQMQSLSPTTQRMVIIPPDKPEVLIKCINTGHIHACVCTPFSAEEFLSRANECRQAFEILSNREKLMYHVALQRKQVAQAAKKLKAKEKKGQQVIRNRKIEIAQLKNRISDNDFTMEKLVEHCGTPKTPAVFYDLFKQVCTSCQRRLLNIAPDFDRDWCFPSFDEIDQTNADSAESGKIFEQLKGLSIYDTSNKTDATPVSSRKDQPIPDRPGSIDDHFVLTVSEDRMTASLAVKKVFQPGRIPAADVLKYLKRRNVCAGLTEKKVIKEWLNSVRPDGDSLVVAKGRPPAPGKNGRITWHFPVNHSVPGRMGYDGTMDFRDKGETPFVEKDALLAEKTSAVEGADGVDVYSVKIPAVETVDPEIKQGPGTRLSEDGKAIFSAIDGKPCVDNEGRIRVNESLVIDEDVDFTTGHIHFDGDIVVKGTIRSGFEVKGVNLTAGAVEGARIELSGDLKVANGIVDTQIRTVGNIHTRFINKCEIFGFGDFIVQNEIVDSNLLLGGHCLIPSGSIVTASISARRGIDAKNIGSRYSQQPSLRIGIDDHAAHMIKEVEADLEESRKKLSVLKEEMASHLKQETRVLKRIDELDVTRKERRSEIEQTHRQSAKCADRHFPVSGVNKEVSRLKNEIHTADDQTIECLEKLDRLAKMRDETKAAIQEQEEINLGLISKKKRLTQIKKRKTSSPEIIVHGTIFKGTRIAGPNSQTRLKWDHDSCVIREEKPEHPVIDAYKISILGRRS